MQLTFILLAVVAIAFAVPLESVKDEIDNAEFIPIPIPIFVRPNNPPGGINGNIGTGQGVGVSGGRGVGLGAGIGGSVGGTGGGTIGYGLGVSAGTVGNIGAREI